MTFSKDGLVSTEYQPLERGQPPVHFGERTSIQSVLTSPWVLRWASIPATYNAYRAIRRNGTIAMARELKVAPILASDWTIDADDDAPDEWKTLIEKIFMPLRDEFLAAALYYGDVDFGYTCFEKVIEPKDGYLKLLRLKPLLHDITEICIGHQGGFIGVRQLGKDLGLANSVHVGFRVEGSYLYGIPLLENARQAYNWWVDCNEGARRYDRKIAGAHIVVEYPLGSSIDRNGAEIENAVLARTVLDNLEAAGGVAIPRDMAAFMQQLNLESPGWKIWILDAGASQQGSFIGRLEYLDKQLCRCLHIPERAMMEGQHGTLAEAEAHSDVVFTIQDIEHRRVTAELNRQAVDQMLSLNFGKGAIGKVRLKASPIVDEKKAYFKQIYAMLLGGPAGQKELQSLDAASLREQLGLPQVQNDPGDVEHEGANLQAIPGLSAGQPGGEGKGLVAQGPDGQPVTVPGNADNPAAAMANAVWGMREAVALSSTALRKAEEWAKGEYPAKAECPAKAGPMAMADSDSEGDEEQDGEPLALADIEQIDQEPWYHTDRSSSKSVDLGKHDTGESDKMNIYAVNQAGSDPERDRVSAENGLSPRMSFGFTRTHPHTGEMGHSLNKGGKVGLVFTHVAKALDSLLTEKRPVSVTFSAIEPDRQKAYQLLMHYAAEKGLGDGEYEFTTDRRWPPPGRRTSGNSGPQYFHVIHRSAADLPQYEHHHRFGSPQPAMAYCNQSEKPLELAGSEPVEQEPWQEDPNFRSGILGYKTKSVPIGDNDHLRFEALVNRGDDDDLNDVRDENDLDYPHEVLMSRGTSKRGMNGRFSITGQGKSGQVISHISQALRELVNNQKPVSVEFSADEPSRQKAYHHMMRRLAKEGAGNGEYAFLHEPGTEDDTHYGIRGKPAYYHIVHIAAADLPRYRDMEEVGAGEKVAMSGATMADVLTSRPMYGRLSENMNSVAMANLQDEQDPWGMQRKSISEAIDAPEYSRPTSVSPGMRILQELRARRRGEDGGYANMSPGQKILFELRARRGGVGMANDPPEGAEPANEAGLHPRQLADLQTLASLTQREGGRIGAGRMDELRGKWRSSPPHDPSGGHKTRLAEARDMAVNHGLFVVEPESGKYVPGPNYGHFLQSGEKPVTPAPYVRNPHARRSLAEREASAAVQATSKEQKERANRTPAPTPKPIETGVEGMVANMTIPRFKEVMGKNPPPEGVDIAPHEARDVLSLMEVIDRNGGRAGMANFQKDRARSLWTNPPRDPESKHPTHLHDILGKMVDRGIVNLDERQRGNRPLDLNLRKKAFDFAKQNPQANYSAIAREVGVDKATARQWFKRTPGWQTWTPEGHSAQPSGGGVARTFTYANGPTYDYMRSLQKAMDANRQITYVKGKPRKPGEPRLNSEQQEQANLHAIAHTYNQTINDALDELSAKTDDPEAIAQIEQAKNRDWGQEILDRVYARKNTKYANMDDKINRFGETFALDELPKYSPDQGPFDEWLQEKMEETHDRIDAEHNKEMRPAAGYKGKRLHEVGKSKGQESDTVGDILADPSAIIPGESRADRTQRVNQAMADRSAAIKDVASRTQQPGEAEPENKQPKMVSRMDLGQHFRNKKFWDSPEMVNLRDLVRDEIGRGGLRVFEPLVRGKNEGRVIEKFSNRRAYHKYKAAVVSLMREELQGKDPEKAKLLRALEWMMDTKESRQDPLRMSNLPLNLRALMLSNRAY
ncbi:MAG: hypothetical protein WCJ35_22900 [Planctomycetota bacterium]